MEGQQGGRLSVVKVFHERDVAGPVLELGGRVIETRIIRGDPEQYVHLIEMSHRSRMRFDKELKAGGRHWIHVESRGPMPSKSAAASTYSASTAAAVEECVHPTPVSASVPAVSAAAATAPQAKRARSAAAAAIPKSEWHPATVTWNGKPAKALVMRVPGSAPVMYHVRWKQGRHGFCEASEAISADDVAF
jgi:hypothetical protein